ncbi:MAG: hypothetical protein JWP10_416 [Nocardioidaceae bacterium]|nr:hypothetical protein [Nocardioidaceae bacterium]
MVPIRYAPIVRLLEARPARAGATKIVAIDGPSGAGKTTFADGLSAILNAPVLHVEDLYRGWDGLAEAPSLLEADVLQPLSEGRPGAYRPYDWTTGDLLPPVAVPASDVLIVEGVGSGARICAPYTSVLVWVDDDESRRKVRALARDGGAYEFYWDRWAAQELIMWDAEHTAERADVRVMPDGRGGILVETSSDREEAHGQHEAQER